MTINQLKFLDELVRLRSFKKAAAQNYVSTSTLTRQVSAMEEELGFPLFTRSALGVTLTEQGSAFYRQTRTILTIYENAVASARAAAGSLQTVRVEIFSYNRKPITNACEAVGRLDSTLRFNFVSCRLVESFSALLNHRLDISLLTDIQDADEHFFTMPIYFARPAVIVPDSHPFAEKEHLLAEDLDGQTILIASTGKEHRYHLSGMAFYHTHCPNSTLIHFQHPHQADAISQMNHYLISSLSILEPEDGFRLLQIEDAPPVKIGSMCRAEDRHLYQGIMEQCRHYFIRTADSKKVETIPSIT